MTKSEAGKFIAEFFIGGPGADFDDDVYIESAPNFGCGGVGNQQGGCGAAKEDDFVEQRAETSGHARDHLRVSLLPGHHPFDSRLLMSFAAMSRSRARPSRMASSRASSS